MAVKKGTKNQAPASRKNPVARRTDATRTKASTAPRAGSKKAASTLASTTAQAGKQAAKPSPQPRHRTKLTRPTKKASAGTQATGKIGQPHSAHTKAATANAQTKSTATRDAAQSERSRTKTSQSTPVRQSRQVSRLPAATTSKRLLTEAQLRAMPGRDYMNVAQLAYFRDRLITMRQEVLDREIGAKQRLHEPENFADPADRATAEEEHWLDLRLRERESMLLRKIDSALQRIHSGEYGYCEKTGEEIGIPRLLARPTATVCVDVKGQDEKAETHFRDH